MKQGWEIKTLGEVCEIKFGTRVVRKRDGGTIYPVYGGGGATFKMDCYNREDALVVARFAMSEKCTRFVKGKFFLNDSGLSLHAKREFIEQAFLTQQIFFVNDVIYKMGRGAAQKNLKVDELEKLPIVIPPLSEQQRIVEVLDKEFERIGTIRKNAETNLQYAKDLMQAKLKEELLPKKGWERKKLEDICTTIVDCPHTTPLKSESKTNFPCIRTSELKDGYIDWGTMQYLEESEYQKRISRLAPIENDIVYAREGSIGGAVLLPNGYKFSLGQRTMLLRPNQEMILPQFLLDFIISDSFRKQVKEKTSQGGVLHINVKDVKILNVFYPSKISDQHQIVSRLDRYSETCRKIEENSRTIISHCDALKQALLRKAFNGEL